MTDTPATTPDKKPEIILCCAKCECLTFYHHEDGNVECANCGQYMSSAVSSWRNNTIPVEDEDLPGLENTAGCNTTVLFSNEDLSRKRVFKTIKKWEEAGEVAVVAVYNKNGEGKNWCAHDTKEFKDWSGNKLIDLGHILKGERAKNDA